MHDHAVTHEKVTLLLKHRQELLGYLRNKIASPELAEDLLQDSLLKALRSAPGLHDEEKLLPWFYRILRNAVIDTYRSRGAAPGRVDTDVDLLEAPAEPTAADEQSLCECFRLLVPTLKPEYAAMIERFDSAPPMRRPSRWNSGSPATPSRCAATGPARLSGNAWKRPAGHVRSTDASIVPARMVKKRHSRKCNRRQSLRLYR